MHQLRGGHMGLGTKPIFSAFVHMDFLSVETYTGSIFP